MTLRSRLRRFATDTPYDCERTAGIAFTATALAGSNSRHWIAISANSSESATHVHTVVSIAVLLLSHPPSPETARSSRNTIATAYLRVIHWQCSCIFPLIANDKAIAVLSIQREASTTVATLNERESPTRSLKRY